MESLYELMQIFDIEEFGICDYTKVYSDIPCRAKSLIPQSAKSVITCLFPYYYENFPNRNVSRYSIPDDYHDIVGDILKEVCKKLTYTYGGSFVPFCDISPLDEKQCATLCGLGFLGKNGLLINKKFGTYFFIGEIVTDIHFHETVRETPLALCESCGNCAKKCPGKAISENGVDYNKCASKLTQKKQELTASEVDIIKAAGFVWGCDICQDVCPHNAKINKTALSQFSQNLTETVREDNLDDLLARKAYGYKGKKLMLRNLKLIK